MLQTEKKRVVTISVLASLVMTIAKFTAALLTGSLGILSEAFHSLVDLGATIVTWFAVRWSDAPPDEDHHYGHAKAESLAALIETGLLFVLTGVITYEAISRLFNKGHEVEVTWWAFAIILGSIIIDYNRARALKKVAIATKSEALEADALHFSSDMWSSACVLVGLLLVWAGFPYADSLTALVVSVFVARAGWKLAGKTIDSLLDAAPEGVAHEIRTLVEEFPNILGIKSLRLRPAGPTIFVSLVFEVPRTMAVDVMRQLKDQVAQAILTRFPQADITVTANPVVLDDETIFQRVMLIASRHKLDIHHLTIEDISGKLAISFDLEVNGEMPLQAAHRAATTLETDIRQELGPDIEVGSHIEPQPERHLPTASPPPALLAEIGQRLKFLCRSEPELQDLHNIRIRQNDLGLYLHYHCRFNGQDTVEHVHDILDRVETGLKQSFPRLHRIIAHAEPVPRYSARP